LLEPYIVSEIVDADGNTVLKQEPTVVRQTISKETSDTMRTLIQSVVEEGTAKNAKVAGFSIGGKTGTSEKIDVFDENGQRVLDKIVSFVGIAPMENPEYIVLVALDTPSRATGIYISGGVMAAPTVGAVLADILPYLEVPKAQPPVIVTVPEVSGMEAKAAEKALKELGLTAVPRGSGDTVTAQLPAADTALEQGSQVLLYLGEGVPESVTVPDFTGMTPSRAAEIAAEGGVILHHAGNQDPSAQVQHQDIPPGTAVEPGCTVTITFTDPLAHD
jgi:stage V sporulation protein D (sporulation-specific penicillin-binding protein)